MWNSFESCRLKLYQNRKAKNFTQTNDLKNKVFDLMDSYKNISISRAKAEAIVFMLGNMEIFHQTQDVFLTEVNHGLIMADFSWRNNRRLYDEVCPKEVMDLEDAGAINATMDFGHIAPDWQYILEKGFAGIVTDLEAEKSKHNEERKIYYDERILVYTALQEFFIKCADLVAQSNTPKSNFMSGNLRYLAYNPPKTLAQAMQLILLYYVLQTELDAVTIRSLGGLDRMLYPFFKADLESGRYTKEQLGEITNYFLWKIYCMEVTANLPFYICGTDDNGNDATNEFTLFLLEKYRELDIHDPKIHVMYHENIDEKVLSLILEMIREGKNSFVFINTKQAATALEKIGINEQDAKRLTVYGCYETAAEGTEIPCTCGGMINMPKALEMVLKKEANFVSFRAFYDAVIECLFNYTSLCMDAMSLYEARYSEVCPSLIMSPTYKHSRESGIDIYCGGAKYNNTSVVGAGLATLVDSLVVVENLVFKENRVAYSELRQSLLDNWKNSESLRLYIRKNYAKFGNHKQEADTIAKDIYTRFANLINNRKNGRGGVFRCGMFSVDWRFWMGEKTAATPDGRYNGEPISKNLAAVIGQDKNGVTAYLKSLSELDSTLVPDGYVADVVIHSSAVSGNDGMAAFGALLTTFMNKGGFAVHFNILSPDMLINAQKEPEKYRNLQIRLCGWNVRFVDLDKAQQDEFIKQSTNAI